MSGSLTCPDCSQAYLPKAGHCRGGRYEGCCKSFRANRDFDLHRTGKHDSRRCFTTDEMQGWEFRGGLWTSPQAIEDAARGRRRGGGLRGAPERAGLDSGKGAA